MRDGWWVEELERLRREQAVPAQVELELPAFEPSQEPAGSPETDQAPRGVVVIEF